MFSVLKRAENLQELDAFKVNLVPKAGLEPARPLKRGILNPLRLPFRHLGPFFSLYFVDFRP